MFNLNLLIQKTNVTSRRAAGFYYYNTDLKNYMEARLPQYKNKMRLLQPLETKLLNKLQHTEIYSLSFYFIFYFFTFHSSHKTSLFNFKTKFMIHPKKKGPIRPSHYAPLSCHQANYFMFHESRPEKKTNHAITLSTSFTPSRHLFCCITNCALKRGPITPSCHTLRVPL